MRDDIAVIINEGGDDGDRTVAVVSVVTIEDSIVGTIVEGGLKGG